MIRKGLQDIATGAAFTQAEGPVPGPGDVVGAAMIGRGVMKVGDGILLAIPPWWENFGPADDEPKPSPGPSPAPDSLPGSQLPPPLPPKFPGGVAVVTKSAAIYK